MLRGAHRTPVPLALIAFVEVQQRSFTEGAFCLCITGALGSARRSLTIVTCPLLDLTGWKLNKPSPRGHGNPHPPARPRSRKLKPDTRLPGAARKGEPIPPLCPAVSRAPYSPCRPPAANPARAQPPGGGAAPPGRRQGTDGALSLSLSPSSPPSPPLHPLPVPGRRTMEAAASGRGRRPAQRWCCGRCGHAARPPSGAGGKASAAPGARGWAGRAGLRSGSGREGGTAAPGRAMAPGGRR